MTDAPAITGATSVGTADRAPRQLSRRFRLGCGLALLAANGCIAANLHFPVIIPLLGLFLLVGFPALQLMGKIDWGTDSVAERLGCGLATTLFILMFGGLLLNTILPPLGDTGALQRFPVLILGDVIVAGLLAWRRETFCWYPAVKLRAIRLTIQEKTVTRLSAASVVLAVLGANRLNNGTGDGVSIVMLALASIALILLFAWRERLDPRVIAFVIYALSLALLLMTSMRGWYTTGHDIQREFRVFELTKTNGNWNIGRFRDAYNACLSITILPTMLWDVTKIHDPYVYKVLYQVAFALCPLLVYRLSLRFTTSAIALIGITYLLCFPTYSNDMPFLNRQEIAFLFIVMILVVLTNTAMPVSRKRWWIAVFSLGLIVSHYSSAAVFLATVIVVVAMRLALAVCGDWLHRAGRRLRMPSTHLPAERSRPVFGLVNVVVLVAGTVLWLGVITQTASNFTSTLASATASISQTFSFNAKSSDVAYNLFSFTQPSSSQLISEYRKATIAETGARAGLYSLSAINARAPTPALNINAPPTALGSGLDHAGINVTDIQTLIHGGAAKLLQLLILIGLVAALFSRDARFRMRKELYLFAVGTLIVLAAEVVAPVISEDYGILRAFMQGLLILSPVLAYGSVVMFSKLGASWARRMAIGLALFVFVSLCGLVTQALGGYQDLLSLDNAGLYYEVYYPHAQEIVGINWIRRHVPPRLATSVQSETFTDEYEFQALRIYSGLNPLNDIYPTLLRRRAYIFLGYPTVRRDLAAFAYKGNLVTYRYPIRFLLHTKDLLFNDGGAEVYR